MTIVLNIISSFHIVFSLCARVGWCDVGTEQTRRMAAWTRAFNIAHLELSLGDCHVAIVTVATQFRHCRSWISVLVFIFVCWSVMNVVIIPERSLRVNLPSKNIKRNLLYQTNCKDHRWRHNVVRTKKWHSRCSRVCHWYSYHILTSSADLLLNRRTTTWNLFVSYMIKNLKKF